MQLIASFEEKVFLKILWHLTLDIQYQLHQVEYWEKSVWLQSIWEICFQVGKQFFICTGFINLLNKALFKWLARVTFNPAWSKCTG